MSLTCSVVEHILLPGALGLIPGTPPIPHESEKETGQELNPSTLSSCVHCPSPAAIQDNFLCPLWLEKVSCWLSFVVSPSYTRRQLLSHLLASLFFFRLNHHNPFNLSLEVPFSIHLIILLALLWIVSNLLQFSENMK